MYKCEKGEEQYKACKKFDADYCSDCPHGIKIIEKKTNFEEQTMLNEEEKKAIEYLNDLKSIKILYGNIFTMFLEQLKKYQNATDTILKLIEKLQKENQELKQENKELNRLLKFSLDYRHKLEEDLYEGASNFILRKDKIREIIEEYKHKDFIKMQVAMKHDKEALKIVEVLEELLEEQN